MLQNCTSGEHSFMKIYQSSRYGDMASDVVRWCKVCGSVVVDVDFDHRTNPGYIMPLKSPEYVKQVVAKQKREKKVRDNG